MYNILCKIGYKINVVYIFSNKRINIDGYSFSKSEVKYQIINISDNKIKETEIGKELRIYIANIFDIFKFYKHSKEFGDGIKASDRIFQLKKIS